MRRLLPVLVMALAIAACESDPAPEPSTGKAEETPKAANTPESVVRAYYAAVKAGEVEAAWKLASADDRAALRLKSYRESDDETQRALNAARTFDVKNAKIEGDTARVFVDIRGPDISAIQRGILGEYVNAGKEVPPADELQVALRERLAAPDTPQATSRVEVIVVREGDEGWRIDFDWDETHPDRAVPRKERKPANRDESPDPTAPETSP